jgi:isoleucyl-tRNA synthetase
MVNTRTLVTKALELRTKSGVKVRQPLAVLEVKGFTENDSYVITAENQQSCIDLVKDELNVHEVRMNESLESDLWLDTTITSELKAEGDAREFIRGVQELRKGAGLMPQDRVELIVETAAEGEAIINAAKDMITKTVGASELTFDVNSGDEIKVGDMVFRITLKKL